MALDDLRQREPAIGVISTHAPSPSDQHVPPPQFKRSLADRSLFQQIGFRPLQSGQADDSHRQSDGQQLKVMTICAALSLTPARQRPEVPVGLFELSRCRQIKHRRAHDHGQVSM